MAFLLSGIVYFILSIVIWDKHKDMQTQSGKEPGVEIQHIRYWLYWLTFTTTLLELTKPKSNKYVMKFVTLPLKFSPRYIEVYI